MRLLLAFALAGGAYYGVRRLRRARRAGAGSPTNASDAVDDIVLPPDPTRNQLLDAGVQETFPASDPVAVSFEQESAWERRQRGRP